MQNIFKRILSCGMALLMCLGITTVVHSTVSESYSYVADAATDYYADITATKGTALLGQVHDLIVKTHKTYTSYDSIKTYGTTTDPGLDGNGVLEFYTHESIMTFGGATGKWNREHVWCQNLSNGLWGTSNGGSDLHHIRPTETDLNGKRSSKKYGEVSNGTAAYSHNTSGGNSELGGYYNSSTFEPLDNVKGDVARIVMYVYTHYNNGNNVGGTLDSKGSGTLHFTNVMSPSDETAAKKLLLEWNKLDPVDDIERTRNDAVYQIQGNRNPFIDNETYADAIWGNGTATEVPVDPSVKITSLSVNPSTVNLKVGETQKLTVSVTPANASNTVKWNSDNPLIASVTQDGVVTAKAAGTANIYATSTADSTVKNFAAVTVTKSSSTTPTPTPTDGGTITIDSSSFSQGSGQYEFYYWSAGGIGGMAFIFGNNDALQFNVSKKSYYLASNIATKGPIKSVTVVSDKQTTSDKEWKLLTSDTPYEEVDKKPTEGNDQGTKSVSGKNSVTWTVSGNDTYFALTYEAKSGACYLDSIIVEYGGSQGTTPVTPPAVELEGIEIVPSTVALSVGQTKTLTVLPDPLNATADVNWSTSDSSVATVSNGVVTAKSAGTATITATDKTDSSIKSTATVTVSTGAVTPSNTVTVTLDSFTVTDGYGFKEWSQDGFGGIGFIFGGDTRYPADAPKNIQLSQKKDSCYIASNVSAGGIKSITIKNGNPNNYSAEWTLLTSNTPYGEVAGIPDTGTSQGAKTVAQGESVTWTLDGSDKFFALTVEPNEKGFAVYLDSIIIECEGNGQGVYVPDIDEAKLASFHAAVADIDTSEKDLEVFDAKINAAEAILATLTADEKVEAIDDINALSNAKILYDIAASQGDDEIDEEKVDAFLNAVYEVLELNDKSTIEEREAKISAAEEILATMNVYEKFEVTTEIEDLNAARVKLEQDKKKAEEAENPPVPPEPPVNEKLVAFKTAVAAIDDDGTIEEREAQIAAADEIYATLTANEKAEALEDIATLTAAKAKLEQDKNGGGGDDEPTVDQTKLTNFHNAVEAIPENGTLEERWEAIEAAYNIALTFNDAETEAAADDLEAFFAAYKKYLEDANGDEPVIPTPTPSENVKAFKASVAAIPSNGTLEAKFNALNSAIAAYQKLTAAEKETVSEEIATLNAEIAKYNGTVNSYNSSAEDSSNLAVSGMKSFL